MSRVQTTMRNINGKWIVVNPTVEDITSPSSSNQAENFIEVQDMKSTSTGRNNSKIVKSSKRKRRKSTELTTTQTKKLYLDEVTRHIDKNTEGKLTGSSLVRGLQDQCKIEKMENDLTVVDETIETNPEIAQFLSSNQLADISKSLMLPTKYQIILEKFEHLDTVVRYLFNRKQKVIWKKIKKSVEMMTGRSFTLKCLSQIRYIFPSAYTFDVQKGNERNQQLLVILPNLHNNCYMYGDDMKMTISTTSIRSKQFRSNLLALMKYHHQRFLSIECPKIKLNGREVKRWHPKFVVENIPDIPLAYIPTPSHEKHENSPRKKYELAEKRIQQRIENLMRKIEEKKAIEATTNRITDVLHEDNKMKNTKTRNIQADKISLKGIPITLLEKIRQKEKLKRIRYKCENDDKSKMIQDLHKLPEIAKPLQTIFSFQKKSTLPIEFVKRKLVDLSKNITTVGTVEALLRLLMATCSNWLSIIPLREVNYIRINKNKRLRDVIPELEIAISIAEQST